jgi:hypothetical protein
MKEVGGQVKTTEKQKDKRKAKQSQAPSPAPGWPGAVAKIESQGKPDDPRDRLAILAAR